MANSVPTLTNENFHMFEPSPIETSLAANVDNPMTPSARGNLFRYQAQNQLNGENYQAQIQAMHDAQIREAMMAQQTARGGMISTSLKDASAAPGMTDVLRQLGVLPQGVDTSSFDTGTNLAASSKNMGEAGRGLGSMAMGGFTGLAPAAQSVAGAGVGQGPAAIVQAAQVKEAGANARHASGGGASGMGTVSMPVGEIGPNQPTVHFKVPLGSIPGLPFVGKGARSSEGGGDGSADDSAAPMQPTNNPVTPNLPAPQQAPVKTAQQVQQSVMAALPSIAANSPAIHADIVAGALNGAPNVIANPHGPGYIVQGARGQYNATGFA